MSSETQCGTNEVPVAPTPTNEAPQMEATDISAATSNLPPIEAEGIKKPNQTSYVWGHFILLEGERAECKYYGKTYAAGSKTYSTINLRTHLEARCKKYPYGKNKKVDNTQMTLAFRPKKSNDAEGANSNSHIAVSYNESMCREALARMIIMDELPFKFVEYEGFRYYSNVLQPRFTVPTCTTVARDCIRIYSIERDRLTLTLRL
ncbi:zinc finger BED domain-containing protein DAYSLEEPER-like [Quercus suber]|uniref:zinc finger BED domain-containing protein DAYSLEEPER-like n=1 Tax=Quercus suber TaxID=58331 RepID=UPI000CE1D97F|nr:zinc finger BED domain-containing protein DAYSLEEPER-like [Quercus suber]